MIAIYICEDHREELDYVTEAVQNYMLFHQENTAYTVYPFQNPHDMLSACAKESDTPVFCIYLLDIDLGCSDMNGITLAQEIRRTDPVGAIVFITTHDKYMPVTFEYLLDATNFIIKGQQPLKEQLVKTLDVILRKLQFGGASAQKKIRLKYGRMVFQIPEQDILFFRISGKHQVEVATRASVGYASATLKEIMAQLNPSAFAMCTRDIILNLRYVQEIGLTDVQLDCGYRFPVSMRRKSELRKRLLQFRAAQN